MTDNEFDDWLLQARQLLSRVAKGHDLWCDTGFSFEGSGACNCRLPSDHQRAKNLAYLLLPEMIKRLDSKEKTDDLEP
jgi:hypothetical protein